MGFTPNNATVINASMPKAITLVVASSLSGESNIRTMTIIIISIFTTGKQKRMI